MAGDAGVWIAKACILISVADGEAPQRDRSYGACVTAYTAIVNLGVVGVDCKCCAMAVGDTGGVAAADKQAVVGNMVDCPVGMTVNASEGDGVSCPRLENGVRDRAVKRVDGGAGTIGPG